MSSPADLIEALAVTPMYHLIPQQELAPLLSFSRFDPCELSPSTFLPTASSALAEAAEAELNKELDSQSDAVAFFSNLLRNFDDPELHLLKFKKPVIMGLSARPPETPALPPLYEALFNLQQRVEDLDLIELEPLVDDIVMDDKVHILESWADKEKAASHIRYYEHLFEKILQQSSRKRSLSPELGNAPRKRIQLDHGRLDNQKEAMLYLIIDQHFPEEKNEIDIGSNSSLLHQISGLLVALSESNKLANLDVGYLLRAQAICVRYITNGPGTGNNDSPASRAQSFDLVAASESILMIMNAGINNRRLHAQSCLQNVIECIGSQVQLISNSALSNPELAPVSEIARCIDSLSNYLSSAKADERVLTQLEYICMGAFFSETASEGFGSVRNSLLNLLVRIFKSYESQRLFIVNEMLLNIKGLSPQKSTVRQLRLRNGTIILIFTAFILKIIQSYDTKSVSKEIKLFQNLPRSKNPHSATNMRRDTLMKTIASLFDDSRKVADTISEKFLEDITSADSNYKVIFNAFLEDTIALLPLLEWSGSVTMLESLMRIFLVQFEGNKLSGNSEPYVLEIVGKVGHELLQHKHNLDLSDQLIASKPIPEENFISLQKAVLREVRELPKETRQCQEYQYVLLRYLRFCEALQERATGINAPTHIFAMDEKNSLPSLLESSLAINKHIDDLLSDIDAHGLFVQSQKKEFLPSSNKAHLELVLCECLDDLYDQYFCILISSLESSKAKVATKAIKLLSRLIEIDTRILLIPKVNQSISKLLTSNSSLSRDAVIDLLGTYVSETSELIVKYCKAICDRAGDSSVLVRRRVIKLMKDMYLHCLDVEARGYIARSFMKQIKDSDKFVSDFSRQTLIELWFNSTISLTETSEVMAQVMSSHAMGSKELMAQFLSAAENDISKRVTRQKLKLLTDLTIELIVNEIESSQWTLANTKLILISTFLSFDGKLMNYDDFLLLEPYIFEHYEERTDLCLNILTVLKLLLQDNKSISTASSTKLRDELLKRLTRLETLELHQAIPIVQLLSNLLSDNSSISNALLSSMRMLKGMLVEKNAPQNDSDVFKCCKLLHLLGCIGAYCDLETSRSRIELGNVGLMPNETIVSLILKYLLQFSKVSFIDAIKIASIKNVVTICSFRPKIFLSASVLSILDTTFESGSVNSKLAVVEGLNGFLAREEKALASALDEVSSSKTAKLDLGNFHGTVPQGVQEGISASLIQRFLAPVLVMCLADSSNSTLIPVQFIRLVTNLGFANPKVCISTIIALEASTNKIIKKIATELHSDLFDKYESLTDRSYTEALKLGFQFTKNSRRGEYLGEISFLRSVYKIVNRSYLSKKKFVLSLAKLFTLNILTTTLPEALKQRDLVAFLSVNLLVVNITSLEEVCLLLYHLDRSITMDGMDLSEKIKSTIESKSGLGMSMENLQLMFLHAQAILALIYLRQLLAASYGVGPAIMDTFRPSKPEMELRHAPRSVLLIDYPTSELELGINLAEPSGFGKVFTKLVLSMRTFTT